METESIGTVSFPGVGIGLVPRCWWRLNGFLNRLPSPVSLGHEQPSPGDDGEGKGTGVAGLLLQ